MVKTPEQHCSNAGVVGPETGRAELRKARRLLWTRVLLLAAPLMLFAGRPAAAQAPGGSAPTNLRVTGVTATTVTLIWQDNSFNPQETSWDIERITDSLRVVIDSGSSGNGFLDTGLTPGTAYFYRVRAKNAFGVSDWSNQVTAVTLPAAPLAPGNVRLTPISAFAVRIEFDPVAGATSYLIQRRCIGGVSASGTGGGGDFITVATLPADVTSAVVSPGGPGQTCFFRVIAVGPGGLSIASAEVTFRLPVGGRIRVDRKKLTFQVSGQQIHQVLRVTIMNVGFETLFVNIPQPGNAEFQVVGELTPWGSRTDIGFGQDTNLALAPRERRIIEVQFSPELDFSEGFDRPFAVPGRRFDFLLINHTDFTSGPFAGATLVNLFGNVPRGPRRGGGSGGGGGGGKD